MALLTRRAPAPGDEAPVIRELRAAIAAAAATLGLPAQPSTAELATCEAALRTARTARGEWQAAATRMADAQGQGDAGRRPGPSGRRGAAEGTDGTRAGAGGLGGVARRSRPAAGVAAGHRRAAAAGGPGARRRRARRPCRYRGRRHPRAGHGLRRGDATPAAGGGKSCRRAAAGGAVGGPRSAPCRPGSGRRAAAAHRVRRAPRDGAPQLLRAPCGGLGRACLRRRRDLAGRSAAPGRRSRAAARRARRGHRGRRRGAHRAHPHRALGRHPRPAGAARVAARPARRAKPRVPGGQRGASPHRPDARARTCASVSRLCWRAPPSRCARSRPGATCASNRKRRRAWRRWWCRPAAAAAAGGAQHGHPAAALPGHPPGAGRGVRGAHRAAAADHGRLPRQLRSAARRPSPGCSPSTRPRANAWCSPVIRRRRSSWQRKRRGRCASSRCPPRQTRAPEHYPSASPRPPGGHEVRQRGRLRKKRSGERA